MIKRTFIFAFAAILLVVSSQTQAQIIEFDFLGNAGEGLLPGNENPGVSSSAIGGETGSGLSYHTDTNVLSVVFDFSGLTGGLAYETPGGNSLAGGIHIHNAGATDPLSNNGGIVFLLNGADDASRTIAEGATSGTIDLDLTLTEAQEIELLNGQYYVNIHSNGFIPGELRGNLVAVPEPGSLSLLAVMAMGVPLFRRRK